VFERRWDGGAGPERERVRVKIMGVSRTK